MTADPRVASVCVPGRLRIEPPWTREDLVLLLEEQEAILGRERRDGRFEFLERLQRGSPSGGNRERGLSVRVRLPAEAALRLAKC